MENRIRIGISACLTGAQVRYDGRAKFDPFLMHTWGRWIEYVPLCPETEAGLPIPRESVSLEGSPGAPRLIGRESGQDYTGKIARWSEDRIGQLGSLDLWGFILKAKSPSCGLAVDQRGPEGGSRKVPGVFARLLGEAMPLLPVTDEKTLRQPAERDLFLSRLFLTRRWKEALDRGRTRASLIDFHSHNKLWLLAHSPEHYRAMGRIVARPDHMSLEDRFRAYEAELMGALRHHATPARHAHVLLHVAGHFRDALTKDESAELNGAIEAYRAGLSGLAVPVTLARHHLRAHRQPCLATQTYLNPHPLEMLLRS